MERLKCTTIGSVACLFVFAAPPAVAGFIQSTSADAAGFTTSTTIGFGEFDIPIATLLTDQYSSLGVEFSPRLFQDPQNCFGFFNFSGNCAGDLEPVGSFSDIVFSSVQHQAGFHMVFLAVSATFEAYLGEELVSSGSAGQNFGPNNFFGFRGVAFDRIRIHQSENSFIMDNLTLDVVPVPAPSTLALMGVGYAALACRRRDRRGRAPRGGRRRAAAQGWWSRASIITIPATPATQSSDRTTGMPVT